MDAYLKKEQNDALFVWVGALEGGFGGWGLGQVGQAQKSDVPSFRIFFPASCRNHIFTVYLLVQAWTSSYKKSYTMQKYTCIFVIYMYVYRDVYVICMCVCVCVLIYRALVNLDL
jgi:hypothetical protein